MATNKTFLFYQLASYRRRFVSLVSSSEAQSSSVLIATSELIVHDACTSRLISTVEPEARRSEQACGDDSTVSEDAMGPRNKPIRVWEGYY